MSTRSIASFLVPATIVIVVLPLLLAMAALIAHFGLESISGPGMGMFGAMGGAYGVALGWTVAAVFIVSALVATLIKEQLHA